MSIIQGTSKAAGGAAGYQIDQSIRFDSVRNSDLTRTLSGDGNLKTGTFSFWMKRSGLSSLQEIFTTYSIRSSFFFQSNDTLSMQIYNGASYTTLTTTAVFRDPSAFAHYLFRWDTTQATDTDRLQFYYNGVLQTVTGAYPAQNSTTTFSDATYTHVISGDGSANTLYEIDGYLAEIHYVDGTALAATDFGEYNADGVWVPIEYTGGSYGTNGFYITGATASDLGEDFSGNNNDYTSSGLTTADQMLDTPTLNFNVINGLDAIYSTTYLTDGALKYQWAAPDQRPIFSTIQAGSGKFYCEVKKISGNPGQSWGVAPFDFNGTSKTAAYSQRNCGGVVYEQNGVTYINGTQASYGSSFSTETIGIALNLDDGQVTFYVDNSSQGAVNLPSGWDNSGRVWSFVFGAAGDYYTAEFNFGQLGFEFTPPTGYKALNTVNLVTPSITDGSAYFNPVLFTANSGTAFSVTGVGFQPDWVWGKSRSYVDNHRLIDVVRGSTKNILSNAASAESTQTQGITSFDSDGFTVGTHPSLNNGTNTYVAWCWLADNTTGSSNTDGSINTTATSVNTTAGFSISTYTGTGANATVGHGLGVAPSFVLVKSRNDTHDWYVWTPALATTEFLQLNSTAGKGTASPEVWNSTAPTSSVVSLGTSIGVNRNTYNYVMYCFAEIPGYSSIGSYTGNGSATDGPFIFTNGMTPKWVMIKRTNSTGFWDILDTTREPFNSVGNQLFANGIDTEASNDHEMDFLSNGIKIRDTSTSVNASGSTYIYMAFAEHPFGGDGVAPATAR